MINIPNLTLLAIDNTHRIENTIKAIYTSISEINFGKIKLITTKENIDKYHSDNPEIEFEEMVYDISDINTYNKYMIYELHNHVDTEFAMNIQDHGFIVNPSMWTYEFLEYDYIGAPWPGPIEQTEGRVGNGGFCIRSKKLIDFCKTIKAEPGHDDWTIGVVQNEYLKEQGFKFAPVQVAMKFSLESVISECEFDLTQTFGFHGRRHHSTQSMINLLNEI